MIKQDVVLEEISQAKTDFASDILKLTENSSEQFAESIIKKILIYCQQESILRKMLSVSVVLEDITNEQFEQKMKEMASTKEGRIQLGNTFRRIVGDNIYDTYPQWIKDESRERMNRPSGDFTPEYMG